MKITVRRGNSILLWQGGGGVSSRRAQPIGPDGSLGHGVRQRGGGGGGEQKGLSEFPPA